MVVNGHLLRTLVACVIVPLLAGLLAGQIRADIYEWDNGYFGNPSVVGRSGTRVPDGAGVNATNGVDLSNRNLTKAHLIDASLANANLNGVNLTKAHLFSANLSNSIFANAIIRETKLYVTEITQLQLSATASYQARDLKGVGLSGNLLVGWSFQDQDLTNAVFGNVYFFIATTSGFPENLQQISIAGADLTGANFSRAKLSGTDFVGALLNGADFSGADIRGARFTAGGQGLSEVQLASTASYLAGDLSGIHLRAGNLVGWNLAAMNLSSADLANANLAAADLNGADLANANVSGANMSGVIGFTATQLYATENYQGRDLRGIKFVGNDLTGWNLTEQNLSGVDFTNATLNGVGIRNSNLSGAKLTANQLYSTASYQSHDLSGVGLGGADFSSANFVDQILTNAGFASANLSAANFSYADLTNAKFYGQTTNSGANLSNANLGHSTLVNADLRTTNLTGANLKNANVANAKLDSANLSNADLSGVNVASAATTTGANFAGARMDGATVRGVALGAITVAQLYSTADYQAQDLTGTGLIGSDFTGANFAGVKLSNADLRATNLSGVNFVGAVIAGAKFDMSLGALNGTGLTTVQLLSTSSHQNRDLAGVGLPGHDLSAMDFSNFNLSSVDFRSSDLTGVNFTGAEIRGAFLTGAIGFSLESLQSTASYNARDLEGVILPILSFDGQSLMGFDLQLAIVSLSSFRGANLSRTTLVSTSFFSSDLTGASLAEANAVKARFDRSNLTNANLSGADLTRARFSGSNLTNADLSNTSLRNAFFVRGAAPNGTIFTGANLTGADLRGSNYYWDYPSPDMNITNAIIPIAGSDVSLIQDLDLTAGKVLDLVQVNNSIVQVVGPAKIGAGGLLRLSFDPNAFTGIELWFQTTVFEQSGTATLELGFIDGVDPVELIGRSFGLFVYDGGGIEAHSAFVVESPYTWDLTNLYWGEITLLAVPEPTSFALFTTGLLSAAYVRSQRAKRPLQRRLRLETLEDRLTKNCCNTAVASLICSTIVLIRDAAC